MGISENVLISRIEIVDQIWEKPRLEVSRRAYSRTLEAHLKVGDKHVQVFSRSLLDLDYLQDNKYILRCLEKFLVILGVRVIGLTDLINVHRTFFWRIFT